MNKAIMRMMGFDEEVDRAERGECPTCGEPVQVEEFDREDLEEYRISGMCKSCQDGVFGEGR